MKKCTDRFKLALSMTIFGTVGIPVKFIGLPSSAIAFARGVIGAVFLILIMRAKNDRISFSDVKSNLFSLILSGAALGANWILLFESYRFTTVATSTLCYYLAPVFVILASPFVLKERLSAKKVICVLTAFIGIIFVSGVLRGESITDGNHIGILLAIGAAILYSFIILINKRISGISAYDKTVVQLSVSSAVILPYMLLTESTVAFSVNPLTAILILVIGVLHTGTAYALYFDSIKGLSAHTVAVFSYIDPVVAVALSALVLREKFDIFSLIGAIMILSSTLFSQIGFKKSPLDSVN